MTRKPSERRQRSRLSAGTAAHGSIPHHTHSYVLGGPLLLALEARRREEGAVARYVLLQPHLGLCHSTRHEKSNNKKRCSTHTHTHTKQPRKQHIQRPGLQFTGCLSCPVQRMCRRSETSPSPLAAVLLHAQRRRRVLDISRIGV